MSVTRRKFGKTKEGVYRKAFTSELDLPDKTKAEIYENEHPLSYLQYIPVRTKK